MMSYIITPFQDTVGICGRDYSKFTNFEDEKEKHV